VVVRTRQHLHVDRVEAAYLPVVEVDLVPPFCDRGEAALATVVLGLLLHPDNAHARTDTCHHRNKRQQLHVGHRVHQLVHNRRERSGAQLDTVLPQPDARGK
jgi:hypothetical protein